MPGVLKRYDAATSTWIPTIGAPTGRTGPLAVVSYEPGSATTKSTTSTTLVAIDTTNLRATFVVPPSGSVLVRLGARAYTSTDGANHFWGLLEGAVQRGKVQFVTDGIRSKRLNATIPVSGLTPGATISLDWAWAIASPHTAYIAVDASGYTSGGAYMEVWDAVGTTAEGAVASAHPARAYRSAAFSLTSGTNVVIPFDTVSFDPSAAFNVATGQYIAPIAGHYQCDARISITSATGERFLAHLAVNGTDVLRGSDFTFKGADIGDITASGLLALNQGDAVTYKVHQVAGTSRAIETGAVTSFLSVVRAVV